MGRRATACPTGLGYQKLYFSANCRLRAPDEVLTTPVGVFLRKFGSEVYWATEKLPGRTSVEYPFTPKIGVLNALMASKRNWIDCRSVMRNFFERLISICLYPGPRSVEMPQVPSPEVGIDMVVGSNQM